MPVPRVGLQQVTIGLCQRQRQRFSLAECAIEHRRRLGGIGIEHLFAPAQHRRSALGQQRLGHRGHRPGLRPLARATARQKQQRRQIALKGAGNVGGPHVGGVARSRLHHKAGLVLLKSGVAGQVQAVEVLWLVGFDGKAQFFQVAALFHQQRQGLALGGLQNTPFLLLKMQHRLYAARRGGHKHQI